MMPLTKISLRRWHHELTQILLQLFAILLAIGGIVLHDTLIRGVHGQQRENDHKNENLE
jgi:hypothetical protein